MHITSLALFVPALCLAQAQGKPQLTVDAPVHDFGQLSPGVKTSHRYTLRNTGDAPLMIAKVTPSCGCTTSLLARTTLAAGESTELEATFDSTGYQGVVRKFIQVESNDPVNPKLVLSFQAEVLGDIMPKGAQVLFEELTRADRRTKSLGFLSNTGQPIHVTDVDLSQAPWLGVTTREEGTTLWVDLDLRAASLPKDRWAGTDSIALHVINPRPSVLNLSVHWERRAPVEATPARIAWAEPAGHDLVQTVLLRHREGKRFRVLTARTSNPLFTVSRPPTASAASHQLKVGLTAAAPPGHYQEKVFLTLDMPGHPELELRVSAELR